MRHLSALAVLLAAVLLAATAVCADVVYLKNGKKVNGTATRSGEKVVVRTSRGVREFDADDVLYISKTKTTAEDSDDSGGWGEPAEDDSTDDSTDADSGSSESDSKDADADLSPVKSPVRKSEFRIHEAAQPESVVFAHMRALEATSMGGDSADIKAEILRWQRKVKDRVRRIDSRWVEPEDIIRRRKLYRQRMEEAEEQFKLADKVSRREEGYKRKKAKFRKAGREKLKLAAAIWADPALRFFLQGVANYKDKQYGHAQNFFVRAIEAGPRVAAFYQGLGMAELAAEEPLEATEAFLTMLRFRPEDRLALMLTKDAVKKIPGSALKNETYLRARELLGEYGDVRYRTRWPYWMLPRKHIREDEEDLPAPEYDRLVYRQAVGVAVSEEGLVVDRSILTNAAEAFVRIDENTVVPAEIESISLFRRRGPTVPFGLVTVPGYQFVPATVPEEPNFPVGTVVTAYGLETYEEMGDRAYPIKGRITAKDAEGMKVSAKLASGDSGSVVLDGEERVVGFLGGRTDPLARQGGKHTFFTTAQADDILRRALRARADRYSMLKRDPVKLDKTTVTVYTLVPETFKE
ncbi:MAG: hypothetical protein ACLFV7_06885 [Phycisphaerae bacterium]